MLFLPRLIAPLALVVVLSTASGCAKPGPVLQTFPPAADLAVTPKPLPTAEIVTSEAAAVAYDIELEAWGEAGWRQVARICRWARARGADVSCPDV